MGAMASEPSDRPAAKQRPDARRAAFVAVVAVLAVALPLGRPLARDSFPLSNFPMFTHDPAPVSGFLRAVGIHADGRESVLSPELIGGTVEVIHAAQTLSNALRAGHADEMCAEIAGRVARAGPDVVEVRVVTDSFGLVEGLLADHPQPVAREQHVVCAVPQ